MVLRPNNNKIYAQKFYKLPHLGKFSAENFTKVDIFFQNVFSEFRFFTKVLFLTHNFFTTLGMRLVEYNSFYAFCLPLICPNVKNHVKLPNLCKETADLKYFSSDFNFLSSHLGYILGDTVFHLTIYFPIQSSTQAKKFITCNRNREINGVQIARPKTHFLGHFICPSFVLHFSLLLKVWGSHRGLFAHALVQINR